MKKLYHQKKVLVTGGCGFIGSALCKKLISLGAIVTIVDNLSTGKYEAIADIKEKVTLIVGDLTNYDLFQHYVEGHDILFHLAAKISVPALEKDPLTAFNENVVGTQHVLQAAYQHGVKRVFFASSAAVYGAQEGICNENLPCNPISTYGYSKLIGEFLCKQYSEQYEIETICARFFNVWCETQQGNSPYANFMSRLHYCLTNNSPITLFGNGNQTRDFIHISQVIDSIVTICLKPLPQKQFVVNIATGVSKTLLELVTSKIKDTPTYTQPIQFEPTRLGDILHSKADCSLLKNFLQY